MWNYWQVKYLAIHSKTAVGENINWWFLSTVWKETHAYSLNGVHLTWQYLHNLPNCQIKATAKDTTYMVLHVAITDSLLDNSYIPHIAIYVTVSAKTVPIGTTIEIHFVA